MASSKSEISALRAVERAPPPPSWTSIAVAKHLASPRLPLAKSALGAISRMVPSGPATIVRGHRVASGQNGNPRFPGGTIRMQAPHFLARGLDISLFHPGTLNVSIAPYRFRVGKPRCTLPSVKWHPTEPAEDFSFFDATV